LFPHLSIILKLKRRESTKSGDTGENHESGVKQKEIPIFDKEGFNGENEEGETNGELEVVEEFVKELASCVELVFVMGRDDEEIT
jgi:hypothetical protein